MKGSIVQLLGIGVLGLFVTSCGNDCAGRGSCIPTWAVNVVISASPNGGPVNDAVVRVSGAVSATVPCSAQVNETVCMVWGTGGMYTLEVSAPGFHSVQRTVAVRDTMGECGCLIVATQRVDIVLTRMS
jgi:hypothetical protein